MSSSNRFGLLSDEPYNVAPVVEKSSAKPAESFEQQKPSTASNARGADDRNHHGNKGKPQGRRNNNLGFHGQNAEFQNVAAPQTDYKQNNRKPRGERPQERLDGQTRQRFQDRRSHNNEGRPKRNGHGKFNTGKPTDGQQAEQTEQPQVEQSAEAAPAEEVKEEVVEEAVPAMEDDGKLTLDQFLAKQAELACADDQTLNVRIAGQDIDEENFETTKVFTRDEEEDDSILGGGRGGHKVSNKHTGVFNSVNAPKAAHMELLNPNANSIMFRGRPSSSSYQSRQRNNKAPVNLADSSAFPALGKK